MKTNLQVENRNDCGFDGNLSWLAGTFPLIRHRGLDRLRKTSRQLASGVMLAAAVFAAPLQAQPGACVGLVSWWPGDGSGDDVVGINHVTSFNGAGFADGMVGQAFRFDGISQGFSSASPPLTSISNTFTLEFWAFPTASRDATTESNSGISGGGQRYAIFPDYGSDDGTKAGAGVSVGINGVSVFEHAMNYLPSLLVYDAPITGWTHIAIVYEDRRPKLYLNGVLVRTGVASQVPLVFPSKTFGDPALYGPYAGLLDEVAIFDRALSPAEIQAAYLSAGRSPCGNVGTLVSCSRRSVWVSESEGSVSVNVVFLRGTNAPDLTVSVDYETLDGTAHAGEDYVAASGTLHFAAGETNKQIAIKILDDALAEGEEQFRLVLSNPTGGVSLGNSNVVIRIQSDEPMTYYVNANNPNPVFPYASWATAATNIQDAVDVSKSGDTVLVTNGVHAVGVGWGGWHANEQNRVAITNAIRLESVNGPLVTTIDGGGGVRCVYLGSNAVLNGFTLTNGVANYRGGGVFAEPSGIVTNCVITGNLAFPGYGAGAGGGASGGTLYNCTVANNTAMSSGFTALGGGGAYGCTLYNCTVTGNSAYYGGGGGGGAMSSTLYNCTVTGNSADDGGGTDGSILYNCTLAGNSAYYGGGACEGTLYNCTVTGNSAYYGGGGVAMSSTLYNCTVTGNDGGGVRGWYGTGSTLYNSIVYHNFGGNYAEGTTLNYCCTTPLPAGLGNIEADPQLVSVSHISLASPCVGAGNATYASGFDIDGETWANPPCMGADQVTLGSATGALTMQVEILYTNFAAGYAIPFVAQNTGRILASVWDFGDGTLVTNQAFVSHAWTAPGVYTVRLTGYNDSFPAGVTSTVQVEVVDAVHYVNVANLNPVFPYASWVTAATNIQDAVTASTVPGRLVLVTNGVYRTGSVEANGPNRVALTNVVVLRSVNGPDVTTIEGASGDQPVRCAYVGNRAVLSGFTLTRGKADAGGGACSEASGVVTNCTLTGNSASGGGGASGGTLYNCVLTGNSAIGDYGYGGGVSGSTLFNCTLIDNSAYGGGGASSSTLNNCTVTGNSAFYAGGVNGGTLNNCIVYFNHAPSGDNYGSASFEYSCTTPLPEGPGNIGAYPQLTWDMHLLPTSPCVAAGSADYATGRDIDGEPWANPPSMGADQFVPGPVTGALTMEIHSDAPQVAPGYALSFEARNNGRLVRLVWDFGDGTLVTNQPFTSHTWGTPGVYTVRLTGYNDSFPLGVTTAAQVEVVNTFHYLDAANPNPVYPYSSWATAARNIQDAVAASAVPGRQVLVKNGVYRTGAVTANGANRVGLTNVVVLRSVNGPAVTTIEGMLGDQATRCAYVGNGAVLSGFTLTRGQAGTGGYDIGVGGGVYCEPLGVVTNCVITGNSAMDGDGGGAYGGTLSSSTLTGNSANAGGGANSSILYNCTLANNRTQNSGRSYAGGGGACGSILYNCTLTGNSSDWAGGGAYGSTLYNCALTGNSAEYGAGAYGSTLYNCTLTGNSGNDGGGACGGTLHNCTLTGNSAHFTMAAHGDGWGGGALWSTLYNCTLTGNAADSGGGGATASTLYNCIVYFNTAVNGANYYSGPYYQGEYITLLNYCCATPIQTNGVGNITNAPLFVDYAGGNLHLQPNSPCVNAGNNSYVTNTTALDGLPRIVSGTVDIGAYEYQGAGSTISYAWLQQYGLPTDGSADATDPDRDGLNTWQEWRCQTDPTNALSVLRLLAAAPNVTKI